MYISIWFRCQRCQVCLLWENSICCPITNLEVFTFSQNVIYKLVEIPLLIFIRTQSLKRIHDYLLSKYCKNSDRMGRRIQADPGFSWGAPAPRMGVLTYYFENFLPKTAWKWKNLDPEGYWNPFLGNSYTATLLS